MVSSSMGSLDAAAGRGARIIASVSRGWGETLGHELTLGATMLGVWSQAQAQPFMRKLVW